MRPTQKENAYRHIRNRVVSGAMLAGERLYPGALAQEIGVSLVPVREAIWQLESEGLVVHEPRGGIFMRKIERRDLMDLVEFRTALECAAAAAAARRISPALLVELDRCWKELCQTAKAFDVPADGNPNDLTSILQSWHLADLGFHMLLFRAAGSRCAVRAIEQTQVMMQMFGHRVDNPAAWANPAEYIADNLRVHRDVYEAVRRHDAKAARHAMGVHMRRAGRNMLARFDWFQRHKDVSEVKAKQFSSSMHSSMRAVQRRLSQDTGNEDICRQAG
jgi:DNA-binding GntR family transcriptional regulator